MNIPKISKNETEAILFSLAEIALKTNACEVYEEIVNMAKAHGIVMEPYEEVKAGAKEK